MTNAFGVELDSAGVRRAIAEDVPETVIAAIYLLHERTVDEIVAKLRSDELGCPASAPVRQIQRLEERRISGSS
jgi:hypothetical protein